MGSKSLAFWLMMIFARGSKPCWRAFSALVFRLFLYGRYRSSSVVNSSASLIFCSNSGVSTSCSFKAFKIDSLRFSRASNCSLNFTISAICTSSRLPVRSFRYREIKGMVQSSLSKSIVFLTNFS